MGFGIVIMVVLILVWLWDMQVIFPNKRDRYSTRSSRTDDALSIFAVVVLVVQLIVFITVFCIQAGYQSNKIAIERKIKLTDELITSAVPKITMELSKYPGYEKATLEGFKSRNGMIVLPPKLETSKTMIATAKVVQDAYIKKYDLSCELASTEASISIIYKYGRILLPYVPGGYDAYSR